MQTLQHQVEYTRFDDAAELAAWQRDLLQRAFGAVAYSYAPYSRFRVGVAMLLSNGLIVLGSNQENASSPAGLCAERTALAVAVMTHPQASIVAIAIRAQSETEALTEPVAPCGICRQTLLEQEQRQGMDIKILMQGTSGPIVMVHSIKDLLPMYFRRHHHARQD